MKKLAPAFILSTLIAAAAVAEPISLTLSGTSEFSLWASGTLTKAQNPGYPSFPGSAAWPAPIYAPAGTGDAWLDKIANGIGGGGPFPSQSGLYFGGTSAGVNRYGGALRIGDDTPVTAVSTVALQIEIGQAFGYDFFNNDVASVVLSYTTASGTFEAPQTFAEILRSSYTGSVQMPTGPGGALQAEDIDLNLWGMQWDLSDVTESILSYKVEFAAVEHASLRSIQLHQTSFAYGAASAFPGDLVFTGAGGSTLWSHAANWQNGILPDNEGTARLTGSGVILDTPQATGNLKIAGSPGFVLSSTGGALLSSQYGIATTVDATISAAVQMDDFNVVEVAPATTLTMAGQVTGAGFYKKGAGDLALTADNFFDEGTIFKTNGLVFRGGTTTITGTNTFGGPSKVGFSLREDTTVILSGGDHRLDAKFIAHLDGTGSRLVLGASGAGSDQTFSGLTGVAGAQIVNGGGLDRSTLTIDNSVDFNYLGRLGGDGVGENNLLLVKTGTGTLSLGHHNTHTGGTTLLGGLASVTGDGAFGSGPLVVNGGGIQYGGAFQGLRGLELGANGGTLDPQGYHLSYDQNITGSGRLTKGVESSAQVGVLTLTGHNTYTGGTTIAAGYLSVDSDQRLGAAPTTFVNGHLIAGGVLWASESFTLNANRGLWITSGALGVAQGKTLTYGGAITDSIFDGTSFPTYLNKTGPGTLVLTGSNTYTNYTTIGSGRLVLDFSASAVSSDILKNTAFNTVYLTGGDLEVIGKSTGTTSQTFTATNIGQPAANGAQVNIKVDSHGGDGTTLTLGAITRSGGASVQPTLNFDLPATGAINTTTTTNIGGVLTSATGNGIAYATVAQTDWAAVSAGKIVAFSAYETSTDQANWGTTEHIALTTGASGVTTRNVGTVKLTDGADLAIASGNTLTLAAGSLLITGQGQSEISGGTIRGANGSSASHRALAIFQNNTASPFTIHSVISNNSGNTATALVKTGDGELILTGNNTFSARLFVQGGTLSFSSEANLGVGTQITIDDATLRYTGPGGTLARSLTLGYNGSTLDASGTGPLVFGNYAGAAISDYAGNFAHTLTLTGTNPGDNVYNNVLRDVSFGATSLVKSGPGTWVLAPGDSWNVSNNFTGGVTIQEGTLKVGRVNALNPELPNLVTFGALAPTGSRLALNGYSVAVAGLAGGGSNTAVENASSSPATLTINAGVNQTFVGSLRDGTGGGALTLVKTGPGTQTFTGPGTYTGGTTVSQGELIIDGAFTGGGPLAVGDDATLTLHGSFTASGSVTVDGTIDGTGNIAFAPGALLTGSGAMKLELVVGSGLGQLSKISPGHSPGQLDTASETWAAGGNYLWEINHPSGGPGLAWDHLNITGTLDITASAATPFTIRLASLAAGNLPGLLDGFDQNSNYTWIIATASSGITGFDAANLVVDATGFSNTLLPGSSFTLSQSGNDLLLTHAVPEPSAVLLLMVSAVGLCHRRRRSPAKQ